VMTMKTSDSHGGNIYRISRQAGLPESGLLDFSASINPLGMPRGAKAAITASLKGNAEALSHYPDPEATRLRSAIAISHGIDESRVIVANGSTELIYLIPRALRPGIVLLTSPTFSEFSRAALASGANIKHLSLKKAEGFSVNAPDFIDAMKGADMAVLCNPNNPTGLMLEKESVLEIAAMAKRQRCVLLVDEAFMDFCPEGSVLGEENPYLIVLRSLTKFYALAGLRLGFGYFPKALMTRMRKLKEPWSVNTLSQIAGVAALKDTPYTEKTLRLISRERRYLAESLGIMGHRPYPSSANYLMMEVGDAAELTSKLLGQGVAVRDCGNFRGLGSSHIRVAVRSRRDNDALLEALDRALGRRP